MTRARASRSARRNASSSVRSSKVAGVVDRERSVRARLRDAARHVPPGRAERAVRRGRRPASINLIWDANTEADLAGLPGLARRSARVTHCSRSRRRRSPNAASRTRPSSRACATSTRSSPSTRRRRRTGARIHAGRRNSAMTSDSSASNTTDGRGTSSRTIRRWRLLEGDLFGELRGGRRDSVDRHRLLAPVEPSKIVCVGLNYKDHAAEQNKPLPAEPLIFIKPSTAVDRPRRADRAARTASAASTTRRRSASSSARARRTSPKQEAHRYVFGLTCVNDVTARELQKKDVQYTRAKGFDTFAPVGPCIATGLDYDAQDGLGGRRLGQRRRAGSLVDARADLPDPPARRVHLGGHDAAAGRHHLDRHAGGHRAAEPRAIASRSRSRASAS